MMRGRIKMGGRPGRYILEWYEGAQRRRQAGGTTPAEALEGRRRKRFELHGRDSNVELAVLNEEEDAFPLQTSLANFLEDIRAFRKPLTYQKYEHILELFCEYVAPKADARQITTDDVKRFQRRAPERSRLPSKGQSERKEFLDCKGRCDATFQSNE